MEKFSKWQTLLRILKWRLNWNKRNIDYKIPVPNNPKFMSAREAISFIQDNDVCMVAGLAGNQRISVISWALAEIFQKKQSPKSLTLISPGGQGGRGKVPGTLEEWAIPGLTKTLISAHHETFKAFLQLADEKKVELQCIPQGVIALLVEAQSKGKNEIITTTGLGTFCDPEIGSTCIMDPKGEQLVVKENAQLKYHLPKVNVAIFNAPAADKEGNIYVKNCATICELKYAAIAAKKNGGKVIANVGQLIDKNENDIYLSHDMVDAIVVYPDTEQTGAFPHVSFCKDLTVHEEADIDRGIEMIRFINSIAGVTPKRGKKDIVLGRLCAKLISQNIPKKSYVNVGTGLPEEASYVLYQQNCLKDINLFTEAGAIGGIPAPGIFFGAAIAPKKIISSPEIFHKTYEHLDATVLGFLQIASNGNVNASRKRPGAKGFVGPGGFMDFTCMARNVFFIGSWMTGGKVVATDKGLKIKKYGKPKFIDKVDEITFSGTEALKKQQKVFFITHVGVFSLTKEGIQLIMVMPGINIQKDIIDFSPMKITVADNLPTIDISILSGKNFSVTFQD